MKIKLITVVILSIAFVLNASDIIYVDADSPNEPGTGTFNDPFRRIQDAIDDGSDSDTIEIRPGVYTGPGNYNLDNSVNFADFADFSMHWMTEETCIEDLTGDGMVNLVDVAVFAANWLWERN